MTTLAPPRTERAAGTTKLWAGIGALGLAYTLYVWVRWLASGTAHQPNPGPDHYDYMGVLRATEVISTGVFLGLGYSSVVRPLVRRSALGLDGKLFIGGTIAAALDPMYGYFNPTWAMNAHAVSLGTWSHEIPGHSNPGEASNAWGLLWCLPAYIWLGLGAAMCGCWLLDRLQRVSRVAAYAIVLATFYLAFAIIENVWLRTHVYNYVSVPSSLTLWAGTDHQWPVYSPLLIGAYCLGYTWLRDSRDDRGHCAVDRDIDRLRVGRRARGLLSVLAVSGFAAVTTIVAYQIPWSWMSMQGSAASVPALPSYETPGLDCGQPGQPLCASQYLDRLQHDRTGLPRVSRSAADRGSARPRS